jgi:hypothetical protein
MKLYNYFINRPGRLSDKWLSYFSVYDTYFLKFKNKEINLLEIGIQNGGSLEVWNNYFKNAKNIIGSDIDVKCRKLKFKFKKIRLVIGDINKPIVRRKITNLGKDGFDIIIDDGSHKSKDINSTFLFFYPLLNPGGIYLIEDLHCSYWKNFGGGLLEKKSSIEFLKLFIDIINFESWGMSLKRLSSIKFGYPRTKKNISIKNFRDIDSIHFHNSICVIKKGYGPNSIGKRVVSGKKALVFPYLPKSGSIFEPELQKNKNIYF